MNLDKVIENIISSHLFLKLKDVVENNPWHDNETVYDHLLKTYNIARQQIKGEFIENKEAKKLFLEFVNSEFENTKLSDIMLITAILHDCGKLLYYKEGEIEKSLRHVNELGIVRMPGHEYFGSTIVINFLKDTGINNKIIERIAKVIRLHNTFSDGYLMGMENWKIEEVVDDVKARAEGLYKEALFNIYCDVYTAKPSRNSIKRIIEIFDQPQLYIPREYFIK